MSTRWKKKNRCGSEDRKVGERPQWTSLESFTAQVGSGEGGGAVQQSSCQTSGDVFIRPITGRFKGLPAKRLRKMYDELLEAFSQAGHRPTMDTSQPMWMKVEFLDNMMDFELNPPCGCESELRRRTGTA